MTRDEMFAYALGLPDTVDSTMHGDRCVRLRGQWIVNTGREPDALALALDLDTIDFLKATEPDAYFQTPHYQGWPAVLVRHAVADEARLREQIEKAWMRRASRAQKAARLR